MMKKGWIDISQPLTNAIAHWPGDTPFSYETAFTKEQTGSVNIGRITTSLHTGTHVDAPFHFNDEGEKILDLDIELYIGPACVIDVSAYETVDSEVLKGFDLEGVERVLLRTSVPNHSEVFPNQIPELTEDMADYLGSKGVRLLGVDVPSVDALDSKEMETHHALYRNGIHILENIMLDEIEEGNYELIALPLPIKDGDGSPVRAVIRPI
ncbi:MULTISPECIES: arylformamidase [Cytobacillus]|uniref:Kynurenine formamidase n=1 Tax=Cytobacillus oceanisediminis 2691 TaxID=1196031 RepID=A0A160M7C5_9BACI|nr:MULTISPECIES: arylformamidase [Cytobacillus]MBY0156591.1 arylformamidase [Cytobacillus firmus]AND38429.1 arylformamidase [Cytobacillus oceanisediminis 2691]MBU8730179.1 arylformamidase [Cytobacillus oceanisediminis]MCM3242004.1 arylformamidase [Cytobacillus oceanisediminis]MCM3391087.1 arylformamidase [Cytobacillus oceanisediminis]